MKIAVMGAGNIGRTLGSKWAAAGHEVRFGVRNPADAKFDAVRAIGQITAMPQALEGADAVLLSLPGGAVRDFAVEHGARLDGKVVIDATNNVGAAEMNNLGALRAGAPAARLVRAFSNLGWENFAQPTIGGITIDLFYCSTVEARPVADQLVRDVGLRPIWLGDLDAAPTVDGLTRVWFALVFGQKRGRRLALKLVEE